MIEKFFFGSDNPGRETWELVPWVHEQGANEFSVNLMHVEPNVGSSPFIGALENRLSLFRLPDGEREHLEQVQNEPKIKACSLWRLTPKSIAVLDRYLPEGLVAPPTYSENGWIENPRFYRNGELILGAITHEGGGFVRLELVEVELLSMLPITFRDTWEWIG